jgi:phage-related protein
MKWADNSAQAVGLSKTQYATLAAQVGASLKSTGISVDEAAQKTNNLITVGSDLAATFGGTTNDAVDALGAALRGEFDPLERFGIALTQSKINADLAAKGQDGLTGSALAAAKQQAILEEITKQSADATGQFGRESDTAAGAAQRQKAEWENLQAELGTNLLPIMTQVGGALQSVTQWASEHTGVVMVLVGVVGGLAAAVYLVNGAIAAYKAIALIATGVQWAWNAALTANPIGIIIVAIAAFVAAIVILWNKSDAFRNFFIGVWNSIKNAVGSAVTWISGVWNGLVNAFSTAGSRIGAIFSGIGNAISSAFRTAFNFVARIWNNTVGRIGFTVPSWIPGVGGKVFHVPQIPTFHTGGIVPGVPGSETLALLQAGERVTPASQVGSGAAVVEFRGDTDSAFASAFMKMVRTGQIQIVGA